MISIIIPTLNEGKTLERTLTSLRTGSMGMPLEIIISDGKSTDDTRAIAARLGCTVVPYEGTKRQTIGQARNAGAAAAKGDYLVFLDADVTIPEPVAFFKKLTFLFEQESNLVGFTCRLVVDPTLKRWPDGFFSLLINCVFFFINNILRRGGAPGEFQAIRASAFNQIHGYREDLVVTEDNEIFWRLATIGRTRFVYSLTVYHSGRRAHALGWPRLLWLWLTNGCMALFFRQSVSREWKPIR